MKTIEVKLYSFSELETDSAKEKARTWWRNGPESFDDDATLDDIFHCADLLGIQLSERTFALPGGRVRSEPCFYYSGFSSQGDGASFTGTYSYRLGSLRDLQAYAPNDDRLSSIAKRLQEVQRRNFYKLTAAVTQRGRYVHEQSMEICVGLNQVNEPSAADAEEVRECLRAFARWAYRLLESDYEWQQSDEAVDELLEDNGFEFLGSGNRWLEPSPAAIAP
jgi:hypothetical protein